MAYFYHIGFDIAPAQMNQLQVGASLERTLGYLRTLLPSDPGYITVRAAYSVDGKDSVHVIVESEWDSWEELQHHHESSLAEDKILLEFEPHVELKDLTVRIYREVA
jgi:hypothetical protein